MVARSFNFSKINTVTDEPNVTFNYFATPTTTLSTNVDIWKCEIEELEKLLLPFPQINNEFFQGAVITCNPITKELGYFLLITANPRSIASTDPAGNSMAAREIWLASPDVGFIEDEFQRAEAAAQFVVNQPNPNDLLWFIPLKGNDPSLDNSITPLNAGAACVNPTRVAFELYYGEFNLKILKEIADIQNLLDTAGLSNFLIKEHSVSLDKLNQATGELTIASGSSIFVGQNDSEVIDPDTNLPQKRTDYLYKAGRYERNTPVNLTLTPNKFARIELQPDGTLIENFENNVDGITDSEVGINETPSLVPDPWTFLGSATSFDPNGFHLFQANNSQQAWQRTNEVSLTEPNTFIIKVREIQTSDSFKIIIDAGPTYTREELIITPERLTLASNGQFYNLPQTEYLDIRLILDVANGFSKVFFHGSEYPVLESELLLDGVQNAFTIGFNETGSTGIVNIIDWSTVNGDPSPGLQGDRRPRFALPLGTVLGTTLQINNGVNDFLGLIGRRADIQLGHRREGRYLFESDLDNFRDTINNILNSLIIPLLEGKRYLSYINSINYLDINIGPCKMIDTTNLYVISSDTDIAFSASTPATNGASGLAIGESLVVDQVYYIYACRTLNPNDDVIFVLSENSIARGDSLVGKLPSQYTIYRQLPAFIATYDDSGTVRVKQFQLVNGKYQFGNGNNNARSAQPGYSYAGNNNLDVNKVLTNAFTSSPNQRGGAPPTYATQNLNNYLPHFAQGFKAYGNLSAESIAPISGGDFGINYFFLKSPDETIPSTILYSPDSLRIQPLSQSIFENVFVKVNDNLDFQYASSVDTQIYGFGIGTRVVASSCNLFIDSLELGDNLIA